MTATKPLLLVDGYSYLFRAYHALPPFTTKDGRPTGALYGMINMLRKLLDEYQPSHIAVVFDAPGKTFRDELYDQYKANRDATPEDLLEQIPAVHEWVKAMGLPLLSISGVEADDVIGTLAVKAAEEGMEVLIVTGDKDMAQLVNPQVRLLDTMKNVTLDAEGVEQKYGVPPTLIIDYLALMGDNVDNIPGIPGVGPKTAAKWLKEHGSLNAVVENADQIKGKIGERLREHLNQLDLSRQLATIHCEVKLEQAPTALTPGAINTDALRDLYQRYEFKSWLQMLDKPDSGDVSKSSEVTATVVSRDYQIVTDQKNLDKWLKKLAKAELFAFDTETTSLDYMQAEIVGVSFATEPGQAAYVPLAHDYPGAPEQLDRDNVLAQLQPLLEDAKQAKLGQHLKYDWHILANHGITLNGIHHDTMLESYVLNSTATRHDMDSMAEYYLDEKTIHFEDIAGKGVKQLTFNQITLEQAGPYAAEDADITLRLHQHLSKELSQHKQLKTLYQDLEIPLIPVLAKIEHTGVMLDVALLREQSTILAKRMQELEQEAYDLAGQPFNLGSPKQLQAILFEQQELPILKKTPKGQPSTAEDVLQELALDYPLPKLILEHRSLSKLKSTYTDKLPLQVNPKTSRVHTSYHQAVTSTGRLSSSDPNLQNIPIRTAEGRRIRQAFIAPQGCCILAADYSQIELRIMAHLSEDKGLLDAFAAGLDIHRATAAEVFAVALDQVDDNQRRSAKAINFGLIYGMSAFGLARQLGISRTAAQEYVDRYFERYPGVKDFMDATRQQAAEQGYVETVFGRRLYLTEINHRNAQRRQAAERTAINAPMQGTAADIIKRAMLAVDAWLQDSQLNARMIMQVHDELVFEVADDDLTTVQTGIRERMVTAAKLNVALEVDIGIGDNWDEAH